MGLGFVFIPVGLSRCGGFRRTDASLSRALGWTNVLIYFFGGIIAGLVAWLLFGFLYREADLIMFLLCGTAGALSGLICWFILSRSNNAELPIPPPGEI
jgi:hypothetical protein